MNRHRTPGRGAAVALLAWIGFCLGWGSPALASENAKGWPILSHDLEVSLDPPQHELRASDRFIVRSGASQEAYRFLLHRDLNIESLRLQRAGTAEALDYTVLPRWKPRDFWSRPDFRELGRFDIVREIVVDAPASGWPQEFELEVDFSGAVYDSLHAPPVAYSRGFETTSGLIDPRGAYLHGDTFWVPWSSEERFRFELTTDLAGGWDSVSQGRRLERSIEGGRTRTTWVAENPEELVYLVAGPYVVRERSHGDVEIYAYTYSNTSEATVQPYLEKAGAYIDRYSRSIGPYPFAKWALVENWWQTGFGMPSFTLLGDRVIRLPFIVDTSYGHEILHCWWGNGVNVRYEEGNWCEGLTAFGADYQFKLDQSARAALDYRRDQLGAYLDFASGDGRDFALADFRERSNFGTQAVGYGKSMMLFHMLRDELGAERFDEGLAEFYREWLFRSAGWSDLAAVFSRVSGRDLTPWFDQWVQRPGAVQLSLGTTSEMGEGWRAEIVQKPPFYDVRVKLRWTDDRAESHDRILRSGGALTPVELPASARRVELDPDFDIYRLLDRAEVVPTLGQALGADSTLVVIGSDADEDTRRALFGVARDWAANQDMRVVAEEDFDPTSVRGRSLYVLGSGPWSQRVERRAREVGVQAASLLERAAQDGLSVVLSVRDPQNQDVAWTLVLPARAADCAALARKIPHYSRYSWLLFEGEQNVDKGQWSLISSPMRRALRRGGR